MPNLRALILVVLAAVPLVAIAAAPAAGSPEEAIRESLLLLRDGKGEDFIRDWCAPERCPSDNAAALDGFRENALASALKSAKTCLHGDTDEVIVKRTKGDPAAEGPVTVFIQCQDGRMPTPATVKKIDGKWRVSSLSW